MLRAVASVERRTGHRRRGPRRHCQPHAVSPGGGCLTGLLPRLRVRVVLGLRTVGEAVNVLLPVAAVGGDVVRARLLNFSGVAGGAAAASALVDLLLQAAAQALFALIGVALLMQVDGATELASWAARGVGIAALALGGFCAGQRFGGARIAGARARRLGAPLAGNGSRWYGDPPARFAAGDTRRPARHCRLRFSLHETRLAAWLSSRPGSHCG